MLVAPRPAARFAGASEYDRSYKWNESRKSAAFSPTGEQLRPSAGIESLRRYNVMEPPLQRKKRVDHVRESVQLGVPDTPTEDSFLVAGQKADKFAPSQAHPNYAKEAHKRRSQSLAAQREQERLEQEQRQREREQRNRQRQANESAAPAVNGGGANADFDEYDEDDQPVATPETPREVKRQLTMPDRQRKQKEKQQKQRRRHRSQEADASVSTKELEAQLAKARREARRLEAEALMERGSAAAAADAEQPPPAEEPYRRPKTPPFYRDVADPYAVRDADYAKKRQLGLADAKRPQGNKPTKASEYQTSYAAAAAAAADAAEHQRRRERHQAAVAENRDAARRSHLNTVTSAGAAGAKKAGSAGAVRAAGMAAATTEYRRQFQYKKPDSRSPAVGLVPSRKSATATAPAPAPAPADQQKQPPKVKLDGREYKPRETLNPQRMSFPLGSYGPLESEYHRAFGDASAAAASEGGETDWQRRLREARELRQRAAQYRLRAYGTHFSRQHLAQVYAPNGSLDAWQPVESARSADDADDAAEDERPRTAPAPHPQAAWDSDPEALPDGDEEADDIGRGRRSQKQHRRRRARSAATGAVAAADSPVRRRLPESETVGRYGTPRIRDRARQGYARHHYDRTTPNYGGVLVGRPDAEIGGDGYNDAGEGEGEAYGFEDEGALAAVASDEEQILDDVEDLGRPLGGRKPVGRLIRESRQLLGRQGRGVKDSKERRGRSQSPLPPAGLPTRDAAPLLDETASHDTPVPMSPRFRQQQKQIQRRSAEPRVRNGSEASVTPPPPPPAQQPLDDAQFSDGFFSDTASLVSSSTISLGSQTLERARQRQEAFWGRK